MRTDKETLQKKLSSLAALSAMDKEALFAIPIDAILIRPRNHILKAGHESSSMHVILSGWAARYGIRADGTRRITGIMLPGDFCVIHALSGATLDHGIVALTHCDIGRIDVSAITSLARVSPAINQALWRSKLIEESILRVWLLNSAVAYQAVAHLLCELYTRADNIGLVNNRSCSIPLTQYDIGDAVGVTNVHVNRVLQRLRGEELIDFSQGTLFIQDVGALRKACDFRPAYLHAKDA